MATTVSLPPPPVFSSIDPSDARKRRREILSFKPKKAVISDDEAPPKKKLQKKYDPDVPMTKEEATIWRREQRRKRNRESAAASRQRQRDRISELETELDSWKLKYEMVLNQIQLLQGNNDINTNDSPKDKNIHKINDPVVPTSPTTSATFLLDVPVAATPLPDEFTTVSCSPLKMISRPA